MKKKLTISTVKALEPDSSPYEVRDTQIKGFLLRVQPSGSMVYYLDYRGSDGKRNRYRIGAHGTLTAAQARDVAEQKAGEVALGVDLQARKKAARAEAERALVSTLRGFLEHEYKPWALTHQRWGEGAVSRILSRFAEFVDKNMVDLNPWVLKKWSAARLKAGVSPNTLNRDIATLKAALSKAVEWGRIDAHPLAKVKPARVDLRPKPRYLEPDEEKCLRSALAMREKRQRDDRRRANQWRHQRGYALLPDLLQVPYTDHLRPMVLLAMNTGLRRGELFSLTWQQVDLVRAIVTVEGARAKSGSTRHVPLNAEALDALKLWRESADAPKGLVFPGKTGERLDNVKSAWTRLLVGANIQSFRFHDLRHHFASKLVMAGVDLNTVRELLGHADIKMTLRYAHLAPEHKAAAVARLVETKSPGQGLLNVEGGRG